MTRPHFTIERVFPATLDEVWELWTTRDGIEAWWGPDGFRVEVRTLELWPGGTLAYAMIAVAPEMVAFMKANGMPTVSEARATFTEVVPRRRLAYDHHTDFIPGVEPYQVATSVDLHPLADGVRMVLAFEAMHDDTWTQRQRAGWEGEIGKLARLIEARRAQA